MITIVNVSENSNNFKLARRLTFVRPLCSLPTPVTHDYRCACASLKTCSCACLPLLGSGRLDLEAFR